MAQPIVTLFELYGSGAEDIGPRVADALGVQWEPQAFTSASIEEAEAARIEQPDDGVLSRIFRTLGGSPSVLEDRGGQALFATSDYELVQENNRHVLEATKDGGVILGRNGAVILADRPGAVHVLLTGAVDDRVARAAAAGRDHRRAGGPSPGPRGRHPGRDVTEALPLGSARSVASPQGNVIRGGAKVGAGAGAKAGGGAKAGFSFGTK